MTTATTTWPELGSSIILTTPWGTDTKGTVQGYEVQTIIIRTSNKRTVRIPTDYVAHWVYAY